MSVVRARGFSYWGLGSYNPQLREEVRHPCYHRHRHAASTARLDGSQGAWKTSRMPQIPPGLDSPQPQHHARLPLGL